MDWIIGLLLLVAGGVIGFFVAKFVFNDRREVDSDKSNEQTMKQIMAQQATTHINETRQVLDSMEAQCDNLREQLNAYEGLLEVNTQSEDGNKLNYFGEHATVYIRNTQNTSKTKREPSEFQPRDFSSGSSGLFDGSKNQQVVDGKQ